MRELTLNEIEVVNGGDTVTNINYAGDALTIGGGILAGLGTATVAGVTAPAWMVVGGVIGAYYGGQAIGNWAFG